MGDITSYFSPEMTHRSLLLMVHWPELVTRSWDMEGAHGVLGERYCPPHPDFTSSVPARQASCAAKAIRKNNRHYELSPKNLPLLHLGFQRLQ